MNQPSLRFRGHPTAEPARPPRHAGTIPDRFVVWLADLDPTGGLVAGVLLEVVGGTTTVENLVHPGSKPSGHLRAYARKEAAWVDPGGRRTLGLIDREEAGRLLRSRGYKAGDVVVTDDVGPQLVALADIWRPARQSKPGLRPEWSLLLAGCTYRDQYGRVCRFSNEPFVRLANIGTAVTAAWGKGRVEAARLSPRCGPIVDVLNVGAALCGQALSLLELLERFDLPAGGDQIPPDELTRLRVRARSVARLWAAMRRELVRLGYGLDPAWLISTGTIAGAVLRDAGIGPLADRFDLPDR
jgi:hypothetical protein